jgi:very-short-patch-repair endonuclease
VSKFAIDWDKPSRSKIQYKVKQFLKPFWLGHVVFEEFPVYGSRMKVDILNATNKIAIEVQGSQHNHFNKFFHNNSRLQYLNAIKRDHQKALWLEKNDFKLLEIFQNEINEVSKEFFKEKFNVIL